LLQAGTGENCKEQQFDGQPGRTETLENVAILLDFARQIRDQLEILCAQRVRQVQSFTKLGEPEDGGGAGERKRMSRVPQAGYGTWVLGLDFPRSRFKSSGRPRVELCKLQFGVLEESSKTVPPCAPFFSICHLLELTAIPICSTFQLLWRID
jgi:hypothetical protein